MLGKRAGKTQEGGRLHPDSAPPVFTDDSGQVLTVPPNRKAANPASDFGEAAPFDQALRDSPEPRAGLLMAPAPLPRLSE